MKIEYKVHDKTPQILYCKEYDELSVNITPDFEINMDDFSKFMTIVNRIKQSRVDCVCVYYYPKEKLIRVYDLSNFDITIGIDDLTVKKVKISFLNEVELLRKLFMIWDEFGLDVAWWVEAVLNNVIVFKEIDKSYEQLGKYFIDYDGYYVFYEDLTELIGFAGSEFEWNSSKFRPIVDIDGYIIGFSYYGAKFLFNEIDFDIPLIRGSIDEYIELKNGLERNIDLIHRDFILKVKRIIQLIDDLVKTSEKVKKALMTYDEMIVDERED